MIRPYARVCAWSVSKGVLVIMSNQSEPLVLVFDCGTQSTRAFLFNKRGEIAAFAKVDTKTYFSKRITFAEKNTEEYWDSIVAASQQLKEKSGKLWDDVISVSITTIRATYVFLDKNMKVVRPSITWLDHRLAGKKQKFSLLHKLAFKLSGMTEVTYKQRRLAPATWMKENEPDNWDKTKHFCLISAFLLYKVSGRLCDCTASQASRLPYNYRKHRWMKKHELTYTVYNCESDKLCELVEPGEVVGYVTREASASLGIKCGLPIIAVGSDKGCETLGIGALDKSVAAISFGTAATVQVITDKYIEPQTFMPAYNACVPDKYTPEIQIWRGYWMVSWFMDNFAKDIIEEAKSLNMLPEKLLDMKLIAVPAGSDGLIVQPYWAPELKVPEAKGTMFGFNDFHTRSHVYKAIIEGIGYALYEGLEKLCRRTGNRVKSISVSGGGSVSDSVCQITADMFGMPVTRIQTYETSGLGAAIIAFTYMNEFKDIDTAVQSMVHFRDTFYPKKENFAVYQKYYHKIYKKLYPRLSNLYEDLYKIANE